MNPSFNYQPCQLPASPKNNMLMNINGLSMNFGMDFGSGLQQQPQLSLPFGMDMNCGFQQQQIPQVSLVPSDVIKPSQGQSSNVVANDNSSSSAGSSCRSFIAERKPLAADFTPGPYDVICARGSAAARQQTET